MTPNVTQTNDVGCSASEPGSVSEVLTLPERQTNLQA